MTKFIERRIGASRPVKKNIVVFYHANCTDGFSAAWAAWKKFGSRAEYRATFHDDPVPKGLKNKEVYTLDMTFPLPVTRQIIKDNKRVTSIDHHVTSKKTTELTHKYSYALKHSGAVLAWKYFHPNKPVPQLLLVVEDFDIWAKKIPYMPATFAYLDIFDFDFRLWDRLVRRFENSKQRKSMLEEGNLLLQHERQIVRRIINEHAQLVRFEGYTVYAVNSSVYHHEIATQLYKKRPPIGIVWKQKNGYVTVSLRSSGNANVAKLAEKYGGGGHKHAAAFRIKSLSDIPWKVIK